MNRKWNKREIFLIVLLVVGGISLAMGVGRYSERQKQKAWREKVKNTLPAPAPRAVETVTVGYHSQASFKNEVKPVVPVTEGEKWPRLKAAGFRTDSFSPVSSVSK